MTDTAILPVVMAGGSGSRLWPLSRELYPKQFMPLLGEASMLLDTIGRVKALATHPFTVVCNEAHRFIVAEQLREAGIQNHILLEPSARNTAPAIAVAALHGMTIADDPVLMVLAADHAIKEPHAFRQAIEAAYPFAVNGKLVTFGIVPQTPETGYGYLRAGESLGGEFLASTPSSRNRIWTRRNSISPLENTSGIAASLCSRPAATLRNLNFIALISWPLVKKRLAPDNMISILSVSVARLSRNRPASQWIMR